MLVATEPRETSLRLVRIHGTSSPGDLNLGRNYPPFNIESMFPIHGVFVKTAFRYGRSLDCPDRECCYEICDCRSKEDLLKLLNLLPRSPFLNLQLRPYLNKLSVNGLPPSDVAVVLRNVVKIMNQLLRRFPNCFADLPLSDLYCGTKILTDKGQLVDDALVTEVDEIMKLRIEKAEELKKKEEEQQKRWIPRRHGEMTTFLKYSHCFYFLSVHQ